MTLDDVPLFAMLKSRLTYLSDRQQVIAQNVANADTPHFAPMDLKPFTPPQQGPGGLKSVTLAETSAMHITAASAMAMPGLPGVSANLSSGYKPMASPDSESTLNGNSVVLEEEMAKMGEARADYNAAVGFYEKSLALIQLAIKRPGQ